MAGLPSGPNIHAQWFWQCLPRGTPPRLRLRSGSGFRRTSSTRASLSEPCPSYFSLPGARSGGRIRFRMATWPSTFMGKNGSRIWRHFDMRWKLEISTQCNGAWQVQRGGIAGSVYTGNGGENLMRNTMLGFATLALVGCQSAPEASQSAALEPAVSSGAIDIQAASDPAATSSGSAIMDQSVAITLPAKGIPAKYARFSGMWAGRLEGIYEAKLAVQTISSNGKVTVTYAWGNLGDNNPGEAAGAGKIVGNIMKLGRLPNGADASFTIQPDGTLAATLTLAGQTYTGVFARQ